MCSWCSKLCSRRLLNLSCLFLLCESVAFHSGSTTRDFVKKFWPRHHCKGISADLVWRGLSVLSTLSGDLCGGKRDERPSCVEESWSLGFSNNSAYDGIRKNYVWFNKPFLFLHIRCFSYNSKIYLLTCKLLSGLWIFFVLIHHVLHWQTSGWRLLTNNVSLTLMLRTDYLESFVEERLNHNKVRCFGLAHIFAKIRFSYD